MFPRPGHRGSTPVRRDQQIRKCSCGPYPRLWPFPEFLEPELQILNVPWAEDITQTVMYAFSLGARRRMAGLYLPTIKPGLAWYENVCVGSGARCPARAARLGFETNRANRHCIGYVGNRAHSCRCLSTGNSRFSHFGLHVMHVHACTFCQLYLGRGRFNVQLQFVFDLILAIYISGQWIWYFSQLHCFILMHILVPAVKQATFGVTIQRNRSNIYLGGFSSAL